MKAKKEVVRKYYKYVPSSWTQPVMTSNGSIGGSDFAVAQTPTDNANTYTMFTSNGNYQCPLNNSFILYHPLGLNISTLYRTTSSMYYVSWMDTFYISFSNDGENWSAETAVSVSYAATTTTTFNYEGYYKYTKIRPYHTGAGSPYAIGKVTITATELTIQETTSSDYDFYKDVDVYNVIKGIKYYKQQTFTQNSSFIVPNNVTSIKVDCVASKGADTQSDYYNIDVGGNGGRVQCDLSVTPGETLYFTVGAIMSPGGIASYNASDIRKNSNTIANRVIVAGGGGNAGNENASYNGAGGAGGGLIGGDGETSLVAGGTGGTQSAGGTSSDPGAQPGTQQMGASGGNAAGGAGYWGGGCGRRYSYSVWYVSGGGGGSSYTDSTLCSNVVHTQGYNNGSGYIIIDYESTSSDYDYYIDEYKAFNI